MTDYDDSRLYEEYDEGRQLGPDALASWVDPLLDWLWRPVDTVVDLGCGTGRFTSVLRDRLHARCVLGVEPSQAMLNIAAAKDWADGIRFENGSAYNIPLPTASVDVVFMSMVLHHIEDKQKAAHEIARVLAPGGLLAIRTVAPDDIDGLPVLQHFSCARKREVERMPAIDDIAQLCSTAGISRTCVAKVRQMSSPSPLGYVDKIKKRSLSSLDGLGEDEFREGLASLCSAMSSLAPDQPIYETMTLYIGRK